MSHFPWHHSKNKSDWKYRRVVPILLSLSFRLACAPSQGNRVTPKGFSSLNTFIILPDSLKGYKKFHRIITTRKLSPHSQLRILKIRPLLFESLTHKPHPSSIQERKEATKWSQGAKTENPRVAEEKARKEAVAARKAEAARLLAEEEAAMGSGGGKSKAPKAGPSKKTAAAPKPAGPGALAAGGGLGANAASGSGSGSGSNTLDESGSGKGKGPAAAPASANVEELVESFQATGIDNALDLLDVVTAKTDKASMGTAAAGIERHPERRFKVRRCTRILSPHPFAEKSCGVY